MNPYNTAKEEQVKGEITTHLYVLLLSHRYQGGEVQLPTDWWSTTKITRSAILVFPTEANKNGSQTKHKSTKP